MIPKMPRGALPVSRSQLAASEPYRLEGGAEIFVPASFRRPIRSLRPPNPIERAEVRPKAFSPGR